MRRLSVPICSTKRLEAEFSKVEDLARGPGWRRHKTHERMTLVIHLHYPSSSNCSSWATAIAMFL